MKTALTRTIAALAASAAMVALALPAAAQGECLNNRQVQAAIAQGEILPLAEVLAMAGVDGSADVLSAQVCDLGGGQLYYQVAVLDSYGESENLVLNATDGSQY